METQEVIEMIERRYFSCLNPDHRHKLRETAEHCIQENLYRKKSKISMNHWDKNKKIELWKRWKSGESQKKLAEEFSVSPSRINQLVHRGERWAWKMDID